ncbi:Glycerol-3-phosphate ABC transporter, ATP-binding protein UgpC [Lysobacter dokdonensis DS-58]|uniref:Glycerol-3-phosphate ABC transporter, ATP-binding protein UgpC n=1 Tax=Lysobacter dokdonensis DS-58 TaxID=1300345 RepID=A0A0A2WPX3_9GAMM|nr:sn-glycerol-3-phosphate ABC transporter ATP-binding protein UgpC [Lysobacter dokdonensis]KGQ20350.1 Glycerol-3-phosphate ABC transporter, ATP-binding protein UgpC [Lysobacter dokdonensis DS-58]
MAQVSLEQVRKVYPNGFVGVAGATFDVADGELLVLVGPSGCGKSTLLRMIAGLEDISSGSLRIGERVVNDVAPKDRDIAMVFQSYALYPHMSVAENLGFGLKLRGKTKAEIASRVDEAARVLELGKLLDRKPAALSGGQRQRVALGRALVRHPQVFLLDEPLSNLDAKLRAGMRVEIARLHRQVGATMVYVTHDQVEAMTLGQRIVVLKDGHVQQIDTPMALYERPANLFVATFLGSPAMNVLQGRLVRSDGLALDLGDGKQVPLGDGHDVPEAWLQRDIAIGIRPESLLPADGGAGFDSTIEMIEALGNETLVNVRIGAQPLVTRMAPRALPPPGETLRLAVAPGRWHAFDAATGERLAPTG